MPLPDSMIKRLEQKRNGTTGPRPKRGLEIFTGLDYPQDWSDFVGQQEAKERLEAAIRSATLRGTRLDHTLLASGLHGIGKTTLAYMLAYNMGVGISSVSGAISVDEARRILLPMQDRDVLFWDELHLAVAGNRNRADWSLPLFTDGVLMTATGAEKMPNVTIIGATTDAGKLPITLLSRFMCVPNLTGYTDDEAQGIVLNLATRMDIAVEDDEAPKVARAANNNPRAMRMILTAMRDVSYTQPQYEAVDLAKAFKWAGVTYDGINQTAQDMLLLLLGSKDHTLSEESIRSQLGEPGPLRHHEQLLLQKGFLTVTGRGRVLTDEGVARAELLMREMV